MSIHCCAHRVALAASQSVNDIPYLKTFKKQLSSLFTYFHNSPLHSAGLHEVQNLLDDPKICLKRLADTQWLSHDIAVTTICRMLPSLIHVAYLESQANEQGCPLAHGLAVAVKAFDFVATVYLLSDILPQVSRLSLVFQTANVNLSLIKPQVSATIAAIRRFKSSPDPYYKKLDEALSSLAIDVTLEEKERFKTHISHKYIVSITTNLEDRFPNTDTSIIGSFSVFDPKKNTR